MMMLFMTNFDRELDILVFYFVYDNQEIHRAVG